MVQVKQPFFDSPVTLVCDCGHTNLPPVFPNIDGHKIKCRNCGVEWTLHYNGYSATRDLPRYNGLPDADSSSSSSGAGGPLGTGS